jgi:uncharacterized membrane protein YqjE
MKLLVLIGIISLFAIGIWLFWLNRASDTILSKVIPAVVIGLIGVLFTIWFSTKSGGAATRGV